MIELSVTPGDLVAGQRSSLLLRFANVSQGTCFDLVFKLRLPAGIVLVGGSDRVEIPSIPAGRAHTHTVTVEAKRPGRFELTSANFSYRDEFDLPVRVTDCRVDLVATAATAPAPVRQPAGRLRVACTDGELTLGEWDVLHVVVTNSTGVALGDVTMSVEGPFLSDGKRSRVEVLRDGATARFAFTVNATGSGRHVPVTVRTAYSHQGEGGTARTRVQEDNISIAVRPAAPHGETTPVEQTVLYLAASPRNMPQLRSDLEMRKVQERLQLSKQRDRYRIEPRLAVRFDDISQALMDYEPQVVHFSGHGDEHGNLCIENDNGTLDTITPLGLAKLFGQHRSTIRCVVVNACHTLRLAEALATKIDHVIGMRYQIGDEAAIEFSVGFYLALFAGRTVPDAFAVGQAHILARPAIERQHLTPLIFPPGP